MINFEIHVPETIPSYQWEQIKKYLDSMPNKLHKGDKGEVYGPYLYVRGEISPGSIDGRSGLIKPQEVSKVTFDITLSNQPGKESEEQYRKKRDTEASQVVSGLIALLENL